MGRSQKRRRSDMNSISSAATGILCSPEWVICIKCGSRFVPTIETGDLFCKECRYKRKRSFKKEGTS